MNIEQAKRLQEKKEEYKRIQEQKAIQDTIKYVIENVEGFQKKYRFVDDCEKIKVQQFVSKLEFTAPGQLKVKDTCLQKHENVYLCCLMGDCAMRDIFIFGKYDDFIGDYDDWSFISPYLLLIDEDFSHYVYIDDYGEIMEEPC